MRRKETRNLPEPGLKQEVAITLQADTSLQEALEGVALPVKAVDNVGSWYLDQKGSLQERAGGETYQA